MSRKYKFHNPEGIYFASFATVYWLDIFIREIYMEELVQSLSFCIKTKRMRLYAWCVMPSHIHLIFKAKRLKLISKLPEAEKQQLFNVEDALLRDFNTKKVYAV